LVEIGRKYGIAIMDKETVTVVGRNGFAQLLHGPGSRWMGRDITVHNPPGLMFHDEQGGRRTTGM